MFDELNMNINDGVKYQISQPNQVSDSGNYFQESGSDSGNYFQESDSGNYFQESGIFSDSNDHLVNAFYHFYNRKAKFYLGESLAEFLAEEQKPDRPNTQVKIE